MALAKKYRLKDKKNFDEVFRRGKTVKSSFFFIRFIKNKLTHSRWAIAVPNKVAPKAVKRNYIKRLVQEALREKENFKKSIDAVVIALPSIVDKRLEEIKSEIKKTTNKIYVN